MENKCKELKNCIVCGYERLNPIIDFGNQPLANNLKDFPEEIDETFPLGLVFCDKCFHVQLTHIVNPDLLFKNYVYMSGVSETFKEFARWFSEMTLEYNDFKPKKVLDIGCNDCTQLDIYKKLGLETFGIDPASNLIELNKDNHSLVCDYFNNYEYPEGTTFDIIISQNSFAHNYDPLGFLMNAKKLMHKDSLLYITTSQADMIFKGEFDTCYHEHISFYNTKSMKKICERAGLYLINAVKYPIHGTSYVFVISSVPILDNPVQLIIDYEGKLGIYSYDLYKKFKMKCLNSIMKFKRITEEYRKNGYLLVGYGAAAKGITFLNISKVELDCIVDDTPLKQNKHIPVLNTCIHSSDIIEKFCLDDRVCFVILPWNVYDEIKIKIQGMRNNLDDVFIKYF